MQKELLEESILRLKNDLLNLNKDKTQEYKTLDVIKKEQLSSLNRNKKIQEENNNLEIKNNKLEEQNN